MQAKEANNIEQQRHKTHSFFLMNKHRLHMPVNEGRVVSGASCQAKIRYAIRSLLVSYLAPNHGFVFLCIYID